MPKGVYPDTEKYIKLGIAGKSRNKYDAKGNLRPQRKSRAKDPERFKKAVEEKTGYTNLYGGGLLGKIVQKGVDEGQDDLKPLLEAVKPRKEGKTEERVRRYEPSEYGIRFNLLEARSEMEEDFIKKELRRRGIKEPSLMDYPADDEGVVDLTEEEWEKIKEDYRKKKYEVSESMRERFNDPSDKLYKAIRERSESQAYYGRYGSKSFPTNYDLVHKQLEVVAEQTANRQRYAVIPTTEEEYQHNKKYGHIVPSKFRGRENAFDDEQPLVGKIIPIRFRRTEKIRKIEGKEGIKDVKDIATKERLESYMDLTKHRGKEKFVIPAKDRKRLRAYIKEHYKDEYGIGRDGVLKLRTRARPKTKEEKERLKQEAIDRQNKQVQDFFSSIPPAPRDDNANLTLSEANIKMKIAEVNKPLPPPPPSKSALLESAKEKHLSRIEKGKTKLVERQKRAVERREEEEGPFLEKIKLPDGYLSGYAPETFLPPGSKYRERLEEVVAKDEKEGFRRYVDLTNPIHEDFGINVGQVPPAPAEGYFQDDEGFYYEDASKYNPKSKLMEVIGLEPVDKYRPMPPPQFEKIKTGVIKSINPSNLPKMGNPLPKWARKEFIADQMAKTQKQIDELSAKTKYTIKRKKIKKKLVVKDSPKLPTMDTEPERKWDTEWTEGYSKGYPKGLSAKESKFLTLEEAIEGAKQHGKKVRAITKQKYGKKGQTLYTLRGSGSISPAVKGEQTIFLR